MPFHTVGSERAPASDAVVLAPAVASPEYGATCPVASNGDERWLWNEAEAVDHTRRRRIGVEQLEGLPSFWSPCILLWQPSYKVRMAATSLLRVSKVIDVHFQAGRHKQSRVRALYTQLVLHEIDDDKFQCAFAREAQGPAVKSQVAFPTDWNRQQVASLLAYPGVADTGKLLE
jgi:hypothetical protein